MAKKRIEISLEQFSKEVSKRLNELFSKSAEFKTQDQLRSFLENEISTATLSVLFSGTHNISAYLLMKVIDALDGSADYVLFGKERKPLLAEFKKMIEETEQSSTSINDKDIREIVLALTEMKISDMGIYETIKKFAKVSKRLSKDKLNAMNVIIDAFLKEIE